MSREPTTEELLERARAGDRDAFDQLAGHYRDDLLAFSRSRLGPSVRGRLEPEDVTQDALLKAFEALDRFEWRQPDSFRRWLCGIAEHVIRNASRKRSVPIRKLSVDVPGRGVSPSQAARREERFDRLERALEALSPDHREVIRLARIEGLRIAAIAERMRRSPGAIKQLLSRALDELKERFGDTASLSLPDRQFDIGGEQDV